MMQYTLFKWELKSNPIDKAAQLLIQFEEVAPLSSPLVYLHMVLEHPVNIST